jgi:hypothetical protein
LCQPPVYRPPGYKGLYNEIERLAGAPRALQSFNDRSSKLGCRGIPAKVKGDVLFAGDCIIAGLLDSAGKIDFAKVPQHHAGTEQEGRWVGFALPCDVRRCAVDALKDRCTLPILPLGATPNPPIKPAQRSLTLCRKG